MPTMLLLAQQATPPAVKVQLYETASLWLALPLFVLPFIFWAKGYSQFYNWVETSLQGTKRRRTTLLVVCNLVLPAIAGVAYDIFDLGEVLNGNVKFWDIVSLCVLAATGSLIIIFQFAFFNHEDQLDLERQQHAAIQARHKAALAVNNSFREVVAIKAARLQGLTDSGRPVELDSVKEALAPKSQIVALLECVFRMYRNRLTTDLSIEATLYLMYFEAQNGYLEPKYGTDGINRDTSPALNPCWHEHFSLNAPIPQCFAVQIAKTGEIGYVEDAGKAAVDNSHTFKYFATQAAADLKSMLVLPIKNRQNQTPALGVVCLYSDQAGYFTDETQPDDKIILENLQDRFLYEKSVERILDEFRPHAQAAAIGA